MGEKVGLTPAQKRLVEELRETGVELTGESGWSKLVISEIDTLLRPHRFERRVFSMGSIVDPSTDPSSWEDGTELSIRRGPLRDTPLDVARRFSDGLSSWLFRRHDGDDEWVVFDRPSGSERDLVVLSEVFGATIVQRHPTGTVRAVGNFGVVRWDGYRWAREALVKEWMASVADSTASDDEVLELLLEFAVHDLGSRGIGSILVHRTSHHPHDAIQARFPVPPPLRITRASDLAPLRHALAQVDGAAVLDASGCLRQLGVRLVPSPEAEAEIDGYGGMRHTSSRRFSYDDPHATVIVVSEDGPVTVWRNGELLGASPHQLR